MDQDVISTFKTYYLHLVMRFVISESEKENAPFIIDIWKRYTLKDAINNIAASWEEASQSTLNGLWHKLWLNMVNDFHGFPDVPSIRKDIA